MSGNVPCAHCGKIYRETDLGILASAIRSTKYACSFECNVSLGQVDETQAAHYRAHLAREKENQEKRE